MSTEWGGNGEERGGKDLAGGWGKQIHRPNGGAQITGPQPGHSMHGQAGRTIDASATPLPYSLEYTEEYSAEFRSGGAPGQPHVMQTLAAHLREAATVEAKSWEGWALRFQVTERNDHLVVSWWTTPENRAALHAWRIAPNDQNAWEAAYKAERDVQQPHGQQLVQLYIFLNWRHGRLPIEMPRDAISAINAANPTIREGFYYVVEHQSSGSYSLRNDPMTVGQLAFFITSQVSPAFGPNPPHVPVEYRDRPVLVERSASRWPLWVIMVLVSITTIYTSWDFYFGGPASDKITKIWNTVLTNITIIQRNQTDIINDMGNQHRVIVDTLYDICGVSRLPASAPLSAPPLNACQVQPKLDDILNKISQISSKPMSQRAGVSTCWPWRNAAQTLPTYIYNVELSGAGIKVSAPTVRPTGSYASYNVWDPFTGPPKQALSPAQFTSQFGPAHTAGLNQSPSCVHYVSIKIVGTGPSYSAAQLEAQFRAVSGAFYYYLEQ